jgi:hypothetical protein
MDVVSYCNILENDRISLVGVGMIQERGFRHNKLYMQHFS